MNTISLSTLDLSLAALIICALALLSIKMNLRLERRILVSAMRTALQLLLVGQVLKILFQRADLVWIAIVALIMLFVAAREVMKRQKHRLSGWWGAGVGGLSMFLSSFSTTILALTVIIRVDPWFAPRYSIPLLGMLLGNTMTGIALGLDRLTTSSCQQRTTIESRLMMGQSWNEAISEIRRDSIRCGLIPIINSMAVAGLVSIPGMMTGQILAGSPPQEAVKYQILIMFLIAGGTGFGTITAVYLGARRLFDSRQRLQLKRLVHPNHGSG